MWKNDEGMDITDLVINESFKKAIEKKGREDAEKGTFDPPKERNFANYAEQAFYEAERSVYFDAYHTRKLRLERTV